MRHAGFHIGPKEQAAWLRCMKSAVDEIQAPDELKAQLWSYMEFAAASMVNQAE